MTVKRIVLAYLAVATARAVQRDGLGYTAHNLLAHPWCSLWPRLGGSAHQATVRWTNEDGDDEPEAMDQLLGDPNQHVLDFGDLPPWTPESLGRLQADIDALPED